MLILFTFFGPFIVVYFLLMSFLSHLHLAVTVGSMFLLPIPKLTSNKVPPIFLHTANLRITLINNG